MFHKTIVFITRCKNTNFPQIKANKSPQTDSFCIIKSVNWKKSRIFAKSNIINIAYETPNYHRVTLVVAADGGVRQGGF
jgi:hypothetical protein